MFNQELLADLIAWAEADEDALRSGRFKGWGKWDQHFWAAADKTNERDILNGACQTAYCIAGQAVAQEHYVMVLNERKYADPDGDGPYITGYSGLFNGWAAESCVPTEVVGKDERGRDIRLPIEDAIPISIDSKAAEILGITDEEAEYLFDGDNDIGELKRIANTLCLSRDLPKMYPGYSVHAELAGELGVVVPT